MKRKIFSTLFAVVLACSLGLVMAAPASAATMTPVTADPVNIMAGATTNYDIGFTTLTTDTIASVDIVFDAGFDVSGATLVGATGLLAGTVSIADQVVTYTVTTPASAAGEPNTITLSGIVNPAAGVYDVTVRTRDAFEDLIDQGIDEEVTIGPAPVSFLVVADADNNVTAGTAFTVVVTAKAEAAGTGATVTGYDGLYLIDFSSTASEPKTIPAFEVVDFNEGVGTTSTSFVLNVVETGKKITATDSELGIIGTSGAITFVTINLDRLTITGAPTSVTAGVAFSGDVTVTAVDALGNVITTYTNEVTWSGGGAGASWPAAYTFDTGDLGVHTFPGSAFILKAAGSQTIIVSDSAPTAISHGTASITVSPAAASKLSVTASEPSIEANGFDSSTIIAKVQDQFGNGVYHSAVITFQTSVGGFTEANGASTYSVASAPYYPYYSPYDYRATATLTSTDTGTATVKVTSGSLTYATASVTLAAPAKATEVWVDKTYDSLGNDGGHKWEYDAWDTIQGGIDNVAIGGTVNVAPGTYKHAQETLPIEVNVVGVTLKSTYGFVYTKIDCEGTYEGIFITAADVTVDGFWVLNATDWAIKVAGADATVENNKITATTTSWPRIDVTGPATGATVSNNTLDSRTCMQVSGVTGSRLLLSIVTLSDNTFSAGICLQDSTVVDITGNTIIGSGGSGIQFEHGSFDDILIQDNIISQTTVGAADEGGIAFRDIPGVVTVTNVTITGNTITDNEDAGIRIGDVDWGTGNTINNNTISGNIAFGIDNLIVAHTVVDAENNWWGDATGPSATGSGTGDAVSTYVDYTPWLTAPYTEPVAPVTTIDLESGWNFISVPKRMADDTDTFGELLEGISVAVAYSYDPVDGWSEPLTDATPVEVLEGYWVDVDTAGTVTLSYKEAAQEVPASKELVGDAWNAIGFSSTTARDADTALMSVYGSWSTVLGWDAEEQAYEDSIIVTGPGEMVPGKGYWIWMTEDDVLSAISG